MFPFARIKTSNTPAEQVLKVQEELGELLTELYSGTPALAAEEYWDVVQAVSTLGYRMTDILGAEAMEQARLNVIQRCKDRGYYHD